MTNDRPRRIAHLDMDAFFASVELLKYPALRGVPVVVGGRSAHQPVREADGTLRFARLRDYVGRGVITTSTYEARALGVFSGMGLMKCARLAPDAILLPADFDAYRHYSQRFKQAVLSIVPVMEDRGIDEIYLDLADADPDTTALAHRLKQAVHDATGLTCSIGVAPNKLLAKLCSDLEKPDGVTIIGHGDIPRRIWPLAVGKVNGIGPKAVEKLHQLGIERIGELAQTDPVLLQGHFGRSYGSWLHQAANGMDERPVVTHSEPKSLSRETTFERDLHVRQDRAMLSDMFTRLCERLADDLQRKGYVGRTVGIKLRFADFTTVTRDLTLPFATREAALIRRCGGECLRRIALEQKIRLVGIRVGGLIKDSEAARIPHAIQGELFH